MNTVNPTDEQIALITNKYNDTPFVMVNLLKFKCDSSGKKSQHLYHQYTRKVLPLIKSIGARVVFYGAMKDIFIGTADEIWDEVLCVYYPSGKLFLHMIAQEEYQNANKLREEALEKCILMISDMASM
ncbi:MAG: DUF1330 domain-containing protein [Spirochaetota bacterium]